MYARTSVASRTGASETSVETIRAVAVLLLVGYHTIGSDDGGGLKIGYPHALRFYADFFVDVRMPLFAFIAGFIYALRPPALGSYTSFVTGKLRRLALPGAVAALAFFMAAYLMDNRFARPLTEMWEPLLYSYAHFWFLQSILVIFVVFGLVDALLARRYTVILLAMACIVYLSDFRFGTRLLSLPGAVYLLPYFLLGVLFFRHARSLASAPLRLTVLLVVLALACSLVNITQYLETGSLSQGKRDYQSLVFGVAACALAMMWLPRVPLLERLSPYAFTIYLYHVFGTVAARNVCNALDISQLDLRFLIGLMGGLALPIALHLIVARLPFASVLVLGERPTVPQPRDVPQNAGAGPIPDLEIARNKA